ncbi:MAG TPA: HAD family hydrolase [Chloroflexi bacterium]|jgi:phosphoglycolate phosphatase|nr:HAD family hydrolase [Chloroflexota bacterium]
MESIRGRIDGDVSALFRHVRALLFDFDGTLVEPGIDFGLMRRRVLDVVAAWGVDPAPLRALPALEAIARVEAVLHDDEAREGFVARCHETILEIELEAAERVRPYAGVPDLLRALADRGLRVGIVTRNCRPAVESILAREPLYHDVLLTRDDVPYVKPDPRHLLSALEIVGVPAACAVMCGDHPMDVQAGQAVGAVTVGILQEGVGSEYFREVGPDLVLSRVTDLSDYLP